MQPNKRPMILLPYKPQISDCQGGHVEAGLQARADATVTVEHSKMPSNALQYMHGQKVSILSPEHRCSLAGCKCEHSWSCAGFRASAFLQQLCFNSSHQHVRIWHSRHYISWGHYTWVTAVHSQTQTRPWRETHHMVRTPLSWLMFNDKPFLLL